MQSVFINFKSYFIFLFYGLFVVSLTSCDKKPKETPPAEKITMQPAPIFNADSAYFFVEKQVSFGKRIPNTASHVACGNYLVNTFKNYGWQVTEQVFEATAFDGTVLKSKNIIATWQPELKTRILLAAHWDTRPFADQEKDKNLHKQPIDGANDGGSGVGILLEIARSIANHTATNPQNNPKVGIDIILFDSEDYGQPEGTNSEQYKQDTWCLGSQYWAKNKHIAGYSAYYGILLDMVGAKDAKFHKEGQSMKFVPSITNKVWQTGIQLGYDNFFVDNTVEGIIDDHIYVNQIAKIPMLDIIEYAPENQSYFNKDWHTLNDNMTIIDRKTLKAVGQTVLQVVYNEN
jgi:glutaminyl-peptide cyclotransferase